MNTQFTEAIRYARLIPLMKERNRREGIRRLLAKIKAAIKA